MPVRTFVTAALCLLLAAPAAAKEYRASRFDARIEVQRGGSLLVHETIVFSFDEGTFTRVFRTIPTRRTDGVEFLSASMDGRPLPPGEEAGQVEVRRDGGIRVEWHFAPTSGVHTFELSYVARGVVKREAGADLLEWRALPSEHDYRIEQSRVELAYPSEPVRPPSVRERRVDGGLSFERGDGTATVFANGIRRNGWVTLSLRFPEGALLDGLPAWQTRQRAQWEKMPGWAAAAAAVLIAGVVILFGIRQSYDRPPKGHRVDWPSMIPPEPIGPALAGAIASNGSVKLEHAMGALFALAERGAAAIREEPKKLGQRQFSIERRQNARELAPHEQSLLDIVFTEKDRTVDRVTLGKARSHLTHRWSRFRDAVRGELAQAGLLDAERLATRRRFAAAAWILLAAAIVWIAPSLLLTRAHGGWPFLVSLALGLMSLVNAIAASAHTPLSNEGLRRAEQWRGFKRHIADPQSIEPRWGSSGPAEARVLPYAVAFGLAGAWAKFMKKRHVETPGWFHASSSLEGGQSFAVFVATGGAGMHGGHGGVSSGGVAGGGASGAS